MRLSDLSKKNFLVGCDLETTGTNPHQNDWIKGSFSILRTSDMEKIDEIELESRPHHWSDEAYRIHLIRKDKAMKFPERKKALRDLEKFLPKKSDFWFLNHANPHHEYGQFYNFDYAFLKMDYVYNSNIFRFWKFFDDKDVISTVTFAKKLGFKSAKLNILADHFNIPLEHHNARSDREAMEQILRELIKYESQSRLI